MTYQTYTSAASGRSGVVRNYASLFEENTLEQAARLSRGNVTSGPVIMLPDAHVGSGACIGTAVRTVGGLYPAAVGVDIGCGMIAVRTSIRAEALGIHERQLLRNLIAKAVPSGVGRSREEPHTRWSAFVDAYGRAPLFEEGGDLEGVQGVERMRDTQAIQFGTLGAGNHFVEVSEDEDGLVWAIVHSGSRGIGNNIARHYVAQAQRQCRDAGIELEDRDLAYLSEGTDDFNGYITNMIWAQRWAYENRETMMVEVLGALTATVGGFQTNQRVNCHHNYSTSVDTPEGRLWTTRKGAIYAGAGVLGVLPGSMATDTYIVSGLGNPDSYETAPHGAGRLHARGRPPKAGKNKPGTGAWAKFNVEDFRADMEARGVTWQERDAHWLLDENPKMYKPIEVVLGDSAELITPIHRLVQLVNVKGL